MPRLNNRAAVLIVVVWFMCSVVIVCAQTGPSAVSTDSTRLQSVRYGGYLGLIYAMHDANFAKLSDLGFCCPSVFGTTSSLGMALGGVFEYPLSDHLVASLRPSFNFIQSTFKQYESTTFNSSTNTAVPGEFSYTVNTSLASVGVDLFAGWRLGKSLIILAGPSMNYYIQKNFDQVETVETPNYVFAAEGTTTRNKTTSTAIGSFNAFALSGTAGLAMEFRPKGTLNYFICPELLFHYGFNSLASGLSQGVDAPVAGVNNGTWKMSSLQFNVAIRFGPNAAPEEPTVITKCGPGQILGPDGKCHCERICAPDEEQLGDCECRKKIYTATLDSCVGVDENGSRVQMKMGMSSAQGRPIVVDEYQRNSYLPLLPYLFFKEGSEKLDRVEYDIQPAATSESLKAALGSKIQNNDAALVYYNILNLIVARMNEGGDKSASLTLRGTTDGVEPEALGVKRALEVYRTLVNQYDLLPGRIIIDSSRTGLPEKKAMVSGDSKAEKAREENRRVEISCSNPSVLAPFQVRDVVRAVNPKELDLHISHYTAGTGIQIQMDFRLMNNKRGEELHKDGERLSQTETNSVFRQPLIGAQNSDVLLKQGTTALEILASSGIKTTTSATRVPLKLPANPFIPVETRDLAWKQTNKAGDTVISVYQLILFDFDSDELGSDNERMLELIKSDIKSGSVVLVEGNTDDIGTDAVNQALSERRAQSVAKRLSGLSPNVSVIANASRKPMRNMDNRKAFGRNYNRNVMVTIKTPIQR